MSKVFQMDPIMSMFSGGEETPQVAAPAPAAAQPETPAAPAAPAAGQTAEEKAAIAKAEEDKKKKAAQGAGGTVLTGSLGVQPEEGAAKRKTLLGT